MDLIAIVDRSWGIANAGQQICTIPADLKRFRELTLGGTVIMGRKTYEVIGKPLEGRKNIVLSRRMAVSDKIAAARGDGDLLAMVLGDAFVIGGESVYRQLLPYCGRAYITFVDADLGADQFCPDLDVDDEWKLWDFGRVEHYGDLPYQFREYRRGRQ